MENPLIEIERVGEKVRIIFRNGPINTEFYFHHECGNAFYAELLRGHFSQKLQNIVEAIRAEEYNRGYKDGRGKKAKQTYFFSRLRKQF